MFTNYIFYHFSLSDEQVPANILTAAFTLPFFATICVGFMCMFYVFFLFFYMYHIAVVCLSLAGFVFFQWYFCTCTVLEKETFLCILLLYMFLLLYFFIEKHFILALG